VTVRDFALTLGAAAGTALTFILLAEKLGKRHSGEGHDCSTTADCELMLACIDSKCVPDPRKAPSP